MGITLAVADTLTPAAMTAPASLGREAGETVGTVDTLITTSPYSAASPGYKSSFRFNDIDDYNNYVRVVNTQRAEGFRVQASVNYANETNPEVVSASRTFCKKLRVTVTSPYFPQIDKGSGVFVSDTLKMSYVFTY